jgi:hypothetical protein
VRDARGGTGTHHVTYELALADSRILRTSISHLPDRSTFGPSVWHHILREQIDVTEAEFWACVQDGIRPSRGKSEPPKEPIPLEIVQLLILRVGLSESELAELTRDEAIARLNKYWTEQA